MNRIRPTANGQFGQLLRGWRISRRLSQLDLALEAQVSARHLSFLESGRASPSREMVLALAHVLDVPLREQNILLQAAGYAPIYRETSLEAQEMASVRAALELILQSHEPFGAMALTRRWDVVMVNRPQAATLGALLGCDIPAFRVLQDPRPNLLRLLFEPTGFRQMLMNWETVAREILGRARRDAIWACDHQLETVVRELAALLPSGSEFPWMQDRTISLVLPVEARHQETTLRFFSTMTTLGAPQDVTLEELRIEAFHAADKATDERVRRDFEELLYKRPMPRLPE